MRVAKGSTPPNSVKLYLLVILENQFLLKLVSPNMGQDNYLGTNFNVFPQVTMIDNKYYKENQRRIIISVEPKPMLSGYWTMASPASSLVHLPSNALLTIRPSE